MIYSIGDRIDDRSGLDRLLGSLATADPFVKTYMVVPNAACQRWMRGILSGYAAGIGNAGYVGVEILTPSQFISRIATERFYSNPASRSMVRQGKDTIDLLLRYMAPKYLKELKQDGASVVAGHSLQQGSEPVSQDYNREPNSDVFSDYGSAGTLVEVFHQLSTVATSVIEQHISTDDTSGYVCKLICELRDRLHELRIVVDADIVDEYRKWIGDSTGYSIQADIQLDGSSLSNASLPDRVVAYALLSGDPYSDLVLQYPGLESISTVGERRGSSQPRPVFEEVISCYDIDGEVRTVIQEIIDELKDGTDPSELCILYSSPQPYRRLFLQYLRQWDIPCVATEQTALATFPLPRLFTGLLEVVINRCGRKTVSRWLSDMGIIMQWLVGGLEISSSGRGYVECARVFIELGSLLNEQSIRIDSSGWVGALKKIAHDKDDRGRPSMASSPEAISQVLEFLDSIDRLYGLYGDSTQSQPKMLFSEALDKIVGFLKPSWMNGDIEVAGRSRSPVTALSFPAMMQTEFFSSVYSMSRHLSEPCHTAADIKRIITRIGEIGRLQISDSTTFSKGNIIDEFFALLKAELASTQYALPDASPIDDNSSADSSTASSDAAGDGSAANDDPLHGSASGKEGVFLGALGQSTGILFKRVFIVGLNADRFPPASPLLSRLLSSQLRVSLGLPDDQYYVSRAKADLADAILSSAKGVIATFHRWDDKMGDAIESHLISDFVSDNTESRQSVSFVDDIHSNCRCLSSSELVLRSIFDQRRVRDDANTREETNQASLGGTRQAGLAEEEQLPSTEGRLFDRISRGISVVSSRSRELFTAFDGRLGDSYIFNLDTIHREDGSNAGYDIDHDEVAKHDGAYVGQGGSRVSATQLETYATCPRRYLFERIMLLRDRYVREEVDSLLPMDEGTIVHEILEKYVNNRLHGAPGGSDALRDIASRHLDEVPTSTFVGHPFLWERTCKRILEELERFAKEENEFETSNSVSPVAAEVPFGMPSANSSNNYPSCSYYLPDGRVVDLRGKIDRLDCSANGKHIFVTDYKTGKQSSLSPLRKDPVDKGKHLQMFVYGHVAKDILAAVLASSDTASSPKDPENSQHPESNNNSESPQIHAQYWLISRSRVAPKYVMDLTDKAIERFSQILQQLVTAIGEGNFPAIPGQRRSFGANNSFDNCSSCAVRSLCPPSRGWIWERKRNALVAESSALRAIIEEGEGNSELEGMVRKEK